MVLFRSTKCSLKFSTKKKQQELTTVLEEYSKVVNFYINYFWLQPESIYKCKLLKPLMDLPETWLSFRIKKEAAKESLSMINSSKSRWKEKAVMPIHKGNKMVVSCLIAKLKPSLHSHFDSWLHLASIGNKIIMDLPIKYHKHFNKLNLIGKRIKQCIIKKNYVQFCFQIITSPKKEIKKCIGIDTGITSLASLNNGKQYGKDIHQCIERIKGCKQNSIGQQKARRALKQRIDEVSKEIILKENPDLIVVEHLNKMNFQSSDKRLLSKNMRRSIGTWNWKYWLKRLEAQCEINRISFRTVAPNFTSTTCFVCGHSDRGNRNGEMFLCLNCDHKDNADINASKNILNRFLTGPYGACYKNLLSTEMSF